MAQLLKIPVQRRVVPMKRGWVLAVVGILLLGALAWAQAGKAYVTSQETTLQDVAKELFGDAKYAPAIMRATNSKHLVDPSFLSIDSLTMKIPAGAKLWIPDRTWAETFIAFWNPNRPEDLFGGGKLVVGSWWTAGGEAEGLNALCKI